MSTTLAADLTFGHLGKRIVTIDEDGDPIEGVITYISFDLTRASEIAISLGDGESFSEDVLVILAPTTEVVVGVGQ